jgi:hypothetical protein
MPTLPRKPRIGIRDVVARPNERIRGTGHSGDGSSGYEACIPNGYGRNCRTTENAEVSTMRRTCPDAKFSRSSGSRVSCQFNSQSFRSGAQRPKAAALPDCMGPGFPESVEPPADLKRDLTPGTSHIRLRENQQHYPLHRFPISFAFQLNSRRADIIAAVRKPPASIPFVPASVRGRCWLRTLHTAGR